MPRNMSFSMSAEAVRRREKTVTRRLAWWGLKPGDVLMAVEKAQGLKKGEKVVPLGLIRVVSVTRESLAWVRVYGREECVREGFPDLSCREFIDMFIEANRLRNDHAEVNRIEFEYMTDSSCKPLP